MVKAAVPTERGGPVAVREIVLPDSAPTPGPSPPGGRRGVTRISRGIRRLTIDAALLGKKTGRGFDSYE